VPDNPKNDPENFFTRRNSLLRAAGLPKWNLQAVWLLFLLLIFDYYRQKFRHYYKNPRIHFVCCSISYRLYGSRSRGRCSQPGKRST